MNSKDAVTCLAALAHDQRLAIFRLLVKEGPSGMPAGEIAEAVGATPTGASFHLKELDRAGLIHATRVGRYIRYAVHFEGMRQLLTSSPRIAARASQSFAVRQSRKPRKSVSKGGTK